MQHSTLPDGWEEARYDTNGDEYDATWARSDGQVVVSSHSTRDSSGERIYPIVVEQHLHDDETGLSTEVQSHSKTATSVDDAESMATNFMQDVNDGEHILHLMGVEEWRDFYHFYCISNSEIPGNITADELIEAIDNEEYDDDIDDLEQFGPDEAGEQTIQVDVFPRTKAEITTDTDD